MSIRTAALAAALVTAFPFATLGHANPSLAEQRVATATAALRYARAAYRTGQVTVTEVATWAERLYAAKRDAGLTGAALVAAAQERVDSMREIERDVRSRVASGAASELDDLTATYFREEAEIELSRVRSGH